MGLGIFGLITGFILLILLLKIIKFGLKVIFFVILVFHLSPH